MRSLFRRFRRNETGPEAASPVVDPIAQEARRMDEREPSARPPDVRPGSRRDDGLLAGRVDADNGWDSGGGTI